MNERPVTRPPKYAFSALTLLVGQQEGHPARKKTKWWGAGMVICLERGADLHMASVKSRLVLPFWYRLTRVVPEKGPLNWCVCVCVCVCYYEQTTVSVTCYLLNDQSVMHSESADVSSNYLTAYTNFTKIFHYKFPFYISKIIFSALVSSHFSILCAAINFRCVQLNSTYLLTCGSV